MSANLERLSTEQLIKRMQAAPDFGYDDEGAELTRRLAPQGKDWIWERRGGWEVVKIIDKQGASA